ncbi:MAG: dephospho-CoA kinase [Gemmatimonadaceae bacterium]|nr:dephospho-CoA kinase [Gemmatimonadaceae bacterium]
MRLIGLTGNIASGKTVVADLLKEKGATLIDADALSREAVLPGTRALETIISRWGREVLDASGNLDRAALRRIVFADQAQLDELNVIIHPEIARLRDAAIEAARKQGDKIVVCVIPLLFERKMVDNFDTIVLVDAPRELRMERLVETRGLDEAEAMNMIASQMPAELKRARADYVIENTGPLRSLRDDVDALWESLLGKTADSPVKTSSIS